DSRGSRRACPRLCDWRNEMPFVRPGEAPDGFHDAGMSALQCPRAGNPKKRADVPRRTTEPKTPLTAVEGTGGESNAPPRTPRKPARAPIAVDSESRATPPRPRARVATVPKPKGKALLESPSDLGSISTRPDALSVKPASAGSSRPTLKAAASAPRVPKSVTR